MQDPIARLRSMVAELNAHPDVVVTRFHVGPPASEQLLAQVQAKLGTALPDDVLSFYRRANGVSLQWFPRGTPRFARHEQTEDAPFFELPEGGEQSGVINLRAVEQLIHGHEDEYWFSDMPTEPAEFLHDGFDVAHSDLAFHQSLRGIDEFDAFRVTALALIDAPSPRVVFGDDHGADFISFAPVPFAEYLDVVLATYGSYRQRVLRFFADPRLDDLPIPTLDEVVAECQLEEAAWREQTEALFDDEDSWDEATD